MWKLDYLLLVSSSAVFVPIVLWWMVEMAHATVREKRASLCMLVAGVFCFASFVNYLDFSLPSPETPPPEQVVQNP